MYFSFDLSKLSLYPAAEDALGQYVAGLTNGRYDPKHRKVFHNKKMNAEKRANIQGFVAALSATNFGAP